MYSLEIRVHVGTIIKLTTQVIEQGFAFRHSRLCETFKTFSKSHAKIWKMGYVLDNKMSLPAGIND